MKNANFIRVKSSAFNADRKSELEAAGIAVPDVRNDFVYTAVSRNFQHFSMEIGLENKILTRLVIGVIPNAIYANKHPVYTWDEFLALIES